MDALKHWDFADTFSGHEIALLLIGCDPALEVEADIKKATPAYQKIRASYHSAVSFQDGNPLLNDGKPYLRSKLLRFYEKHRPKNDIPLVDMESLSFEFQVFLRADVVEWIKNSALSSQYEFQFTRETPEQRRKRVARIVEEHGGNKAAAARALGITATRVTQLLQPKESDHGHKPLSFLAHSPFGINSKPSNGKRSK